MLFFVDLLVKLTQLVTLLKVNLIIQRSYLRLLDSHKWHDSMLHGQKE